MNKFERLSSEFLNYLDIMEDSYPGIKSFGFQLLFMISITTFASKIVYYLVPYSVAESLDMDLFLVFFIWLIYAILRGYKKNVSLRK